MLLDNRADFDKPWRTSSKVVFPHLFSGDVIPSIGSILKASYVYVRNIHKLQAVSECSSNTTWFLRVDLISLSRGSPSTFSFHGSRSSTILAWSPASVCCLTAISLSSAVTRTARTLATVSRLFSYSRGPKPTSPSTKASCNCSVTRPIPSLQAKSLKSVGFSSREIKSGNTQKPFIILAAVSALLRPGLPSVHWSSSPQTIIIVLGYISRITLATGSKFPASKAINTVWPVAS